MDLIINGGKNLYFKKIFEKLFTERFDEILEIAHKLNSDYLIYLFKGDSKRKWFDGFENGVKLFEKIKSGNLKLK